MFCSLLGYETLTTNPSFLEEPCFRCSKCHYPQPRLDYLGGNSDSFCCNADVEYIPDPNYVSREGNCGYCNQPLNSFGFVSMVQESAHIHKCKKGLYDKSCMQIRRELDD